MTDTDFEIRLARALRARAELVVEGFDADAIADAAIGVFRPRPGIFRMTLAAAAVVALVAVGTAGVVVVGGLLNLLPTPPPVTHPSPPPSDRPDATALVAYAKFVSQEDVEGDCAPVGGTTWFAPEGLPTGCSRLWVVYADGTDAHELLPDQPGYQVPIAWSPDGLQLLFEDERGLWLTDASGTNFRSLPLETLCPALCGFRGYTFSPDGTELAFVMSVDDTQTSVVVTMDLVTGRISELASTEAPDAFDPPQWSPDGTRLVFARQGREGEANLFMVDVDGTDFHQLLPMGLNAIEPRWSPDGSLIAFLSDVPGSPNIRVVRPDGSGLQSVTTDGLSMRPNWTADGRLVYAIAIGDYPNNVTGYDLWIMDADGSNKARLPADDLSQLTAANCLVCPYLHDLESEFPVNDFLHNALWQPTP